MVGAAAPEGGAPEEASELFADEADDADAPIFGPVAAERAGEFDAAALLSAACEAGFESPAASLADFDSGLSVEGFVAPASGFAASVSSDFTVDDEAAAVDFGLVGADWEPEPAVAEDEALADEGVSPDFTASGSRSIVTGFFVDFECLGLLLCAIWDSFLEDDAWTPRPDDLAREKPASEARSEE